MALSEDRIYEIAEAYGTLDSEYRRAEFARTIEAEVRKECAAERAALRTERDHMEMAADAEARRVDELTALRKQDTELIRQMLDALDGAIAITMGKIDLRNAAIAAARERLGGKP